MSLYPDKVVGTLVDRGRLARVPSDQRADAAGRLSIAGSLRPCCSTRGRYPDVAHPC